MASLDVRSGSNDRGLVASGVNHTNVVNATTANEAVESSGDDFISDDFFTPTYFVRRNAMEFDISSMPVGSVVTAATLKINVIGITTDTDNYSFNVFFFTRGSSAGGAFVANDYDEAVGTAACDTPKDITGLSGVQTFTLNAAALSAIQSAAGGYIQFSSRISGDYSNSASTGGNLVDAYKGTDGTESNRPRLEVTYTPPDSVERSYSFII